MSPSSSANISARLSIVQPLPYREVTGAGTTNADACHAGALDGSLVTQRVEVKSHRGHVQSQLFGKLGRVDGSVVLTHQLQDPLALPVSWPVACTCPVPRSLWSAIRVAPRPLPFSYLKDIIH